MTLYAIYRVVRLSSPNLNFLVGIGAIILYADIIVTVIPNADRLSRSIDCNVCKPSCQKFSIIPLCYIAGTMVDSFRIFPVLWYCAGKNDPCLLHL